MTREIHDTYAICGEQIGLVFNSPDELTLRQPATWSRPELQGLHTYILNLALALLLHHTRGLSPIFNIKKRGLPDAPHYGVP